jgi:hypothetical protein
MRPNHLQRLPADAAGGTEEGDVLLGGQIGG